MACLFYTQIFLLTTLILVLNLSLYSVLGQTVGGLEKSSMEEEGAREALNYAVSQYNENNNDLYLSRVVKVRSVQKQIVSGKILVFNVIIGKTICLKTQTDLTNCPLNEQTDQQELEYCSFEVYFPWRENCLILTYSSCDRN
ncbi:cystatin-S-like [Mastomys coucha]|uniref:cystatin-S-like n=1 Tax=Mastomys coucha TaxID=35658 RepID=UPI001261FAA9|nr:cystatin-S-like [Mastomys coucha]